MVRNHTSLHIQSEIMLLSAYSQKSTISPHTVRNRLCFMTKTLSSQQLEVRPLSPYNQTYKTYLTSLSEIRHLSLHSQDCHTILSMYRDETPFWLQWGVQCPLTTVRNHKSLPIQSEMPRAPHYIVRNCLLCSKKYHKLLNILAELQTHFPK